MWSVYLFFIVILIKGVFSTFNLSKSLDPISLNYKFNEDIDALKLLLPREDSFVGNSKDEQRLSSLIGTHHDTMLLVHVIFRHGNRTVDGEKELYPKDPYFNIDYFPFGYGQLTNAGKCKEFKVGQNLRKRYNKYLGKYYYPQIVDARSTDTNRTKMSLELVLAGLFPPTKFDTFLNNDLSWQPIPYNYVPINKDKLLVPFNCPNFKEEYKKMYHSPIVQQMLKKYKKIFKYLNKNTGLSIQRFRDVYKLYMALKTEHDLGLKLPQWTETVYPDVLEKLSIKEYYVQSSTYKLQKMFGGGLLQKIITDSVEQLSANEGKFSRKIYLYSAHEYNIATFLIEIGIFDNKLPDYGAQVIVEFHVIDDVPGFVFYFENSMEIGPVLLKVPGCELFCPLKKFERLFKNALRLNGEC